ncbi:endo-N-acetyl-beta-D-glucosaminidase precursor [Niveomyces insectorum RCEF 264]|uniref:Endo-N-acetyl-beta-D-glucosaminidase n=1 Tax=Niveomyces insectorum RCEF 264 TaxID=1081102 RepID=A0A167RB30_9HYPO|nr:endo-N-acetyl-beta-D-glucosaminidase precursor [Niveomyces insectorum RCEF 264]
MANVLFWLQRALWLVLLLPQTSAWPLQRSGNFSGDNDAHAARAADAADDLPRLAIYFQTTHDGNGNPISMLPLITEKDIALTHLIVCSFHINANSTIHLNDFPPDSPHFATLWNETAILQAAGIRVMGMVGGAAAGSFAASTLDGDDATFAVYYAQLHDAIVRYHLQGMDLDVEQAMSQAGITRLVQRLRADFGGPGVFDITLAPVASALTNTDGSNDEANLSGFDYAELEATSGADISFYNAQFYNGFGSLGSPRDFETVVNAGWSPTKVLLGEITSPAEGYAYVTPDVLNATVVALRSAYGTLGGIMGWEYFNSNPGGTAAPWEWAQVMTAILRPNQVPRLTVTAADAQRLTMAWQESVVVAPGGADTDALAPAVNYVAMVNA